MKAPKQDWYRNIWSMNIKNMSWVEETDSQIDFIIKTLDLKGSERILDLACGFGRHSIALARKGFDVVGIDITKDYIDYARQIVKDESLKAEFLCSDIRELDYREVFDVVLNLADGAIGYLENDIENIKIFDLISKALKPGGKHLLDICNVDHAMEYFPEKVWEIGTESVSLPEFSWDAEKKRMLYGGFTIKFGEIAKKPDSMTAHSSIRLYSENELIEIFNKREMKIIETYSDYIGNPVTKKDFQFMAYSRKLPY